MTYLGEAGSGKSHLAKLATFAAVLRGGGRVVILDCTTGAVDRPGPECSGPLRERTR